jgi:hypothetical protein
LGLLFECIKLFIEGFGVIWLLRFSHVSASMVCMDNKVVNYRLILVSGNLQFS